jgi:aminopeptidase C
MHINYYFDYPLKIKKMKYKLISVSLILSLALTVYPQNSQTISATSDQGNKFTPLIELKATSVKNQSATGTCWCFATTSFIESELLRMGKGEFDLSEIVRQNYLNKLSDNYLRQGKGNLGEGSLSHHWMAVFTEKGIVPEAVYIGLNYGSATHNHDELNSFINAVATVPVERRLESPQYNIIVNSILDTYLGPVPESFTYQDKTYTPRSFADYLGINPADYVEITSFTHFPFYTQGQLEIPDNWDHSVFYNVPIDELLQIMDYSLSNGYTVNWDGDVSEPGFEHSKGIATFPDSVVTQLMRQTGYENFTTTDDHLMHITGMTVDQNGTKYFITKNSWGTGANPLGGYLNMSENFVRAKTIFIMVNKNSIPAGIKNKLGL